MYNVLIYRTHNHQNIQQNRHEIWSLVFLKSIFNQNKKQFKKVKKQKVKYILREERVVKDKKYLIEKMI